VEVPLMYFDIYRENQDPTFTEFLSGIVVSNINTNSSYGGYLKVYTNTFQSNSVNGAVFIGSNFISQTDQEVQISFASNDISKLADDPTRFFITWQPTGFDPNAVNNFRITRLKGGGFNTISGSNIAVDNMPFLTTLAINSVKLDAASANLSMIALLPTSVTQGDKDIQAMTVSVSVPDPDAVFKLGSLTFTLGTSNVITSPFINARLFADNGSTSGAYDAGDSEIASGVFSSSNITLPFGNTINISSTATRFHLLISVDNSAPDTEEIFFQLLNALQSGFTPVSIPGVTNVNIQTTVSSTFTTGVAEIIAKLTTTSSDKLTAANTIIPTCSNVLARILLPTGVDKTGHSAVVYSMTGVKITELSFNADNSIEWDGTVDGADDSLEFVPSGIYKVIVTGPVVTQQHIKVLVIHCKE
jgi:hypothetical protein